MPSHVRSNLMRLPVAGSGSRQIRRVRWDTTYCCRGGTWQIHLLWAGQIACRLLEKHGKFDRDNVRRLTAWAA